MKALKLYRAVWKSLFDEDISIEEINSKESGLGLIGPGKGVLTSLLELVFGQFYFFRLHATYHDVFGRIYRETKLGLGYMYIYRDSYSFLKNSPLCGHIDRLLVCLFFGKSLTRKIANQYQYCYPWK